jgi:hypothetical protein
MRFVTRLRNPPSETRATEAEYQTVFTAISLLQLGKFIHSHLWYRVGGHYEFLKVFSMSTKWYYNVCWTRWQQILILSQSIEPVISAALKAQGNNGNHMSKLSLRTQLHRVHNVWILSQNTACLFVHTMQQLISGMSGDLQLLSWNKEPLVAYQESSEVKNTVFCAMMPSSLVEVYWHFGGTYNLHVQGRNVRACCFLVWLTLRHWKLRHYIIPKSQ